MSDELIADAPAAVAAFGEVNPARGIAAVRIVITGPEVAVLVEDQFLRVAQAGREDFEIRAIGITAIDDAGLAVVHQLAFLVVDVGAAIANAEIQLAVWPE